MEPGKARTLLSYWKKANEDRRRQPVTQISLVDMRRHQMLWAGWDMLL